MKQPPAFQFYASDYRASSNVQRMSYEAQGIYIWLLSISWDDDRLPTSMAELAELCRMPERKFVPLWDRYLVRCFEHDSAKDSYFNPKLESIRRAQLEHRQKRSEAGSSGAAKRWQTDGNAIAKPMAKNSSPSPSPSPSPKEEEIQIQPPPKQLPQRYAHGKFENVKLSQAEHEALIEKFNFMGAEERINALSEYIASKPTKYKSHYAVILMWERKNGAKHNGNMDKGERNAETARRLLSRLHSQDSSGVPRDTARSNAGGLSRASAEALFGADSDSDSPHN